MKHPRFSCALLSILLLGCMLLLTACPGGTPPIEPPTPGTGDPPAGGDDTVIYENGTVISGAGDHIAADAAVLTPAAYDASGAQEVSAGNFFCIAANAFAAGKVFFATGDNAARLNGQENKTYNGKGSVLLLPNGLEISGNTALTIQNMVIVGNVTVKDSAATIFENVEIVGKLTVERTSASTVLNACRLTGTTAVVNNSDDLTVMNSYVGFTACGIESRGDGLTVQNCRFAGQGTAISSFGEDAAVKYNTLSLDKEATGIAFGKGTMNAIAAMNVVTGAQKTVSVSGARNAVIVRNTLVSVEGVGNRNLYICDNELGGRVTVKHNNYLLADGNVCAAVTQSDNENVNGDTLMDVNTRAEVGADENLLPHVDKDQFIGMARKEKVRDVTLASEKNVMTYIRQQIEAGAEYVFIAPGAYVAPNACALKNVSGATVYAYGVYAECPKTEGAHNLPTLISLRNTERITFKGLAVGYAEQAGGQVHVLEKLGYNRVRVIASPGMIDEFSGTGKALYTASTIYWVRLSAGEAYTRYDTRYTDITKDKTGGTMTLTLEPDIYDLVSAGDVFTCRGEGGATVSVYYSAETEFRDTVIYGSSGGLCFLENHNTGKTTYYRVADLARSGEKIGADTYDRYLALESEHGVSFYMSRDEWGNYRGTPSYISSRDGAHVNNCASGSQIISCLFENMCDDGTNQKSTHARLAGITVEGDIATVTYKGNLPLVRVNRNEELLADGFCEDFRVGDRVCLYTTEGQLICDTAALSATVSLGTRPSTYNEYDVEYRQVTVKASEVRLSAIVGYDLSGDEPTETGKVLVDNRSRATNGFLIDNTMIKNTRSRGLLLKASNGAVKNCTFRNNAKCGIAVIYEVFWGESSFSESVTLEKNLFDNTGYSANNQIRYRHAPIVISGIGGGTVTEDHLMYRDIRIMGNKFINRDISINPYAIYLQAVRDVDIVGNDFGEAAGETFDNYSTAVCLNGAMNIRLSGNTYGSYASLDAMITGDHYVNIYGDDVGELFPDRP